MPPKQAKQNVITPIFNDLNTKLWWEYVKYSQPEKEIIDNFFNTYGKDLNLLMTPSIYENMQILAKNIGVYLHPYFKTPPKYSYLEEELKENNDILPANNVHNQLPISTHNPKENILLNAANANIVPQIEKIEPIFLVFNNIHIDYITAKCMLFAWPFSKYSVIKFSKNNFDEMTFPIIQELICNPVHKINKLFFDWNPLKKEVASNFLSQIAMSPTIEYLTARMDELDDHIINVFFSKMIEHNNQTLKFIDLYDNNITKKGKSKTKIKCISVGFDEIGRFLATNRTLEYLGLSKNQIRNWGDLSEIANSLGKFALSNEEYEEYQMKDKQREAIIERNKKIKKKENQEPVPYLDPIQQISEGKWVLIKNIKLSILNISKSSLKDCDLPEIEKTLSNTGDNFQLVLSLNEFEEKNLDRLKKKFGKKIYL